MSGTRSSSDRIEVGPEGSLEPGDRTIVSVGNREVGVFNIDGEYRAILNTCLHQNGPLCEGKVLPEIKGKFIEPGKRTVEEYGDSMVVKCPWHGWEYDLETGQLKDDERMRLPVFEVVVEDGTIYLEV